MEAGGAGIIISVDHIHLWVIPNLAVFPGLSRSVNILLAIVVGLCH
jgi:hypothetical protein